MILVNHKLLSVLKFLFVFQTYKKHLVYIRIADFVVHILSSQPIRVTDSFFANAHAKFYQYLLK